MNKLGPGVRLRTRLGGVKNIIIGLLTGLQFFKTEDLVQNDYVPNMENAHRVLRMPMPMGNP